MEVVSDGVRSGCEVVGLAEEYFGPDHDHDLQCNVIPSFTILLLSLVLVAEVCSK